jgi:hypothetical protein
MSVSPISDSRGSYQSKAIPPDIKQLLDAIQNYLNGNKHSAKECADLVAQCNSLPVSERQSLGADFNTLVADLSEFGDNLTQDPNEQDPFIHNQQNGLKSEIEECIGRLEKS